MTSDKLFDVAGLVTVVTGGASGIGLAYASAMASRGALVTLIDRDSSALDAALATIRATASAGPDAQACGAVADVTNAAELRSAIAQTVTRHGRLDVVFANAGISGGPGFLRGNGERNPDGEVERLSPQTWQRVMETNVTSLFHTLQAVVPAMKQQGHGRIIVTSSISASLAETLVSSIYATSKAAVGHMVRQYALELARYGILVNAISPGPVITNIGGGRLKDAEARRPFERAAPLGRIATPDDLQGAALFLASPASAYITGTEIIVDGGRVLGTAD